LAPFRNPGIEMVLESSRAVFSYAALVAAAGAVTVTSTADSGRKVIFEGGGLLISTSTEDIERVVAKREDVTVAGWTKLGDAAVNADVRHRWRA